MIVNKAGNIETIPLTTSSTVTQRIPAFFSYGSAEGEEVLGVGSASILTNGTMVVHSGGNYGNTTIFVDGFFFV